MTTKSKDGETFRQDRHWSATDDLDPDACVTMADKIAFHKELCRRIEAATKPSDLPFFGMDEDRWWTIPGCPSLEQRQAMIDKQMKRYLQRL
jgi:hypothetical protein